MSELSRIGSIYFSTQFYRFILVGGIALIIHWISRVILSEFFDYGAAIFTAYFIGMTVAFILNKVFVFPYSKRSMTFEVFAFILINLLAFPFVWLVAFFLGKYVLADFLSETYALGLAHGFAITLPVFLNFVLHKFITFRET